MLRVEPIRRVGASLQCEIAALAQTPDDVARSLPIFIVNLDDPILVADGDKEITVPDVESPPGVPLTDQISLVGSLEILVVNCKLCPVRRAALPGETLAVLGFTPDEPAQPTKMKGYESGKECGLSYGIHEIPLR